MNPIKSEPVVTAVLALVTAGLGLLAAFGVTLTPEQAGAVIGFVAAAFGVALLVRSRVTPTKGWRN